MTDFYPLRHNTMTRDHLLMKQLERQLEHPAVQSRPLRFQAHPKSFQSDSDTNTSCTPRVMLGPSQTKPLSGLLDTKQRAQGFHKLLHEKLSIIDGSNFSASNTSRLRSASSCTITSEMDYTASCCRNFDFKSKPVEPQGSTSERKSAGLSASKGGLTLSVFESKFKVLVAKCLKSMSMIREILTKGIEPPDGEEDESRRLVRLKEFTNRFSRNYLYPLGRQLKDLSSLDQINPLLVNQKLLSTYQVVCNALQAYQTHLPSSIGNCSHTQLKTLMENIMNISTIHRKQVTNPEENYIIEFIDTFKINAELTTQKIEESFQKLTTDGALKSEQSRISLSKYGGNPKPKNRKRTRPDKRLAMYTVTASFRRDAPWKRAVENLARKKFDVKSKYRTATYKHRPPMQKLPEGCSVPKLKALVHAKQSSVLRTSPMNSPVNEDCIRTMVESDGNEETPVEKEELENMEKTIEKTSGKEKVLMKLLQYTLKAHQNEGAVTEDHKSQIADIANLLQGEDKDEMWQKIAESLENDGSTTVNDQQLTLKVVKSHYSLTDGELSARALQTKKEPKVTVSGEKNARLICITDDNSVEEPIEDQNHCKTSADTKTIAKTSSETQTEVKAAHRKVSKATQKGRQSPKVKISRLKKKQRLLKPLDKATAVHAIQYKLDFYRFCKDNSMYKRSTTCQPWALMNRISEELLNESLLGVAREIEVNDIVEKLFKEELQL